MKYTSSEANKQLRILYNELADLLSKEKRSCVFTAALGEDPETCRPPYSYDEAQALIADTEKKVRQLKHALNVFNSTHNVPGFDMTIDEMLVYLPQLSARVEKLQEMADRLPKERVEEKYGRTSPVIDYTYVNYDVNKAAADLAEARRELADAQLALDKVNTTETFEI
ncbi:MAG: hypothetical protein K5911_07780 [Eubacteriales bacterium]|nr:hypothetical protein [Eubacteriales bacterium]